MGSRRRGQGSRKRGGLPPAAGRGGPQKGRGNFECLDRFWRFGSTTACGRCLNLRSKPMDAKPRKPYPSDPSDAQWALLELLWPPPVSAGAPRATPLREVLNAIFSLLSTGCAWSASPHDFPPEGTVRDSFHRWRRSGVVVADSRYAPPSGPGGGRDRTRTQRREHRESSRQGDPNQWSAGV